MNSPINQVDKTGEDPIYAKSFWGRIESIGNDGRNNNVSYLVRGDIRRSVLKSTKKGVDYSAPLTEGRNVIIIPRGEQMKAIMKSVSDTEETGRENGGHFLKNNTNVYRWDAGSPPNSIRDKEGSITGAKATLKSFTINGIDVRPQDASTISLWWHVHPNISVDGIQLGYSTPSDADFRIQKSLESKNYNGNTFVIGTRDKKVNFYNGSKSIMIIRYSDFVKMGGQ